MSLRISKKNISSLQNSDKSLKLLVNEAQEVADDWILDG